MLIGVRHLPAWIVRAVFGLGLGLAVLAWGGPAGVARAELPPPEIQWFDDPAEALGPVLSRRPRVVAFGEYHQLHKTTAVKSSLRWFLDEILPRLLYWPSDLIVETWVTEGECGQKEKAVVKDVKKTTQRPKKTEDEIVTLLRQAGQSGIQPHILQISCADYQALLDESGEVDYDKLLILLTQQLLRKVHEVAERRGDTGRPILIYGGAIHNDLYPKEVYKNYTYGPQLFKDVRGGYIEVDLYVPEYVAADSKLTDEPWYALYRAQAAAQPKKTALLKRGLNSYIVMFPRKG